MQVEKERRECKQRVYVSGSWWMDYRANAAEYFSPAVMDRSSFQEEQLLV